MYRKSKEKTVYHFLAVLFCFHLREFHQFHCLTHKNLKKVKVNYRKLIWAKIKCKDLKVLLPTFFRASCKTIWQVRETLWAANKMLWAYPGIRKAFCNEIKWQSSTKGPWYHVNTSKAFPLTRQRNQSRCVSCLHPALPYFYVVLPCFACATQRIHVTSPSSIRMWLHMFLSVNQIMESAL